jgi:hypothetical protein
MGAPKNYPETLVGYATKEQADAVRHFAWVNRLSMAEIIRRAVARYIRAGKP